MNLDKHTANALGRPLLSDSEPYEEMLTELPYGYRWALPEECEMYADEDELITSVAISINRGGDYADLAVPWDCMIEFGMDHDHDPEECERALMDTYSGYDPDGPLADAQYDYERYNYMWGSSRY